MSNTRLKGIRISEPMWWPAWLYMLYEVGIVLVLVVSVCVCVSVCLHKKWTRSPAIRRESAHLTWLYVRCKRLFNMKPAWITSVTVHCDAIYGMNIKRQVANLESCGAFDRLRPVLTHLFGLNRELITKFGRKKLETSLRRTVWKIDRLLFHFVTIHASDRQTDVQTDGRTDICR